MGTHRKPASAGQAARIGRVGALAVTLGIGTAVHPAPPPTQTTPPGRNTFRRSQLSFELRIRQPDNPGLIKGDTHRGHRQNIRKRRGKPPRPDSEGHRSHYQCRRSREGPKTTSSCQPGRRRPGRPGIADSSTTKFRNRQRRKHFNPAAAATATPSNVTIEAEALVSNPPWATSIVKDTFASGQKALKFANNASATTTVTLPDFTSVIIRARATNTTVRRS